jgi:hypothetical protein
LIKIQRYSFFTDNYIVILAFVNKTTFARCFKKTNPMKYFHYTVKDDEVSKQQGEIESVPPGFIEFKITLTGEGVYYKLTDGKLTDVIGEGIHEEAARRRVEEFLSGFNVSLV